MDGGRHEVKHTHMGHRQIVQSEEGSRLMRGWLDNILQQNRTTFNSHVLGEDYIGQFISGRDAWAVFPAPFSSSVVGVLYDSGVESYLMLRQQESA
jgi:hypothetical protein